MELTGNTIMRNWYHDEFPTDELWQYMHPTHTFLDLFNQLNEHKEVYRCLFINGGDSTVRDRCFKALAQLMRCDYEYIYDRWLKTVDETEATPYGLNVGDIWYSSWGYDQTNIDWYQVTKVTKCCVYIARIRSNKTETAFMQGETTPVPNDFCGEPMRRKVDKSYKGEPYVSITSYASACPWNGKPMHWSSYH